MATRRRYSSCWSAATDFGSTYLTACLNWQPPDASVETPNRVGNVGRIFQNISSAFGNSLRVLIILLLLLILSISLIIIGSLSQSEQVICESQFGTWLIVVGSLILGATVILIIFIILKTLCCYKETEGVLKFLLIIPVGIFITALLIATVFGISILAENSQKIRKCNSGFYYFFILIVSFFCFYYLIFFCVFGFIYYKMRYGLCRGVSPQN